MTGNTRITSKFYVTLLWRVTRLKQAHFVHVADPKQGNNGAVCDHQVPGEGIMGETQARDNRPKTTETCCLCAVWILRVAAWYCATFREPAYSTLVLCSAR
jgi:hypothetical protein